MWWNVPSTRNLSRHSEAIVCQGETIEQEIHFQAQEVIEAVDQAKRNLTQEVRTATQKKRAVIAFQKQEAQAELARLQSSLEFVKQSMKMQSDQQIVTSKTKMLECMKDSVSHAKLSNFEPYETIDSKYERNW